MAERERKRDGRVIHVLFKMMRERSSEGSDREKDDEERE